MGLTALLCLGVVAGMTGLAFSAPALYSMFCKVTGYGGTTQVASGAAGEILDRQVEVRFNTTTAPGLPLEFEPLQRTATLRLGESGLAYFRIRNLSDQPVTAVATFNVTPHKTGRYFEKLQCFCFEEMVLPPHAEVEAPVVFYVDPELARDRDTEEVGQITLSYTFFRSLDDAAAADDAAARTPAGSR